MLRQRLNENFWLFKFWYYLVGRKSIHVFFRCKNLFELMKSYSHGKIFLRISYHLVLWLPSKKQGFKYVDKRSVKPPGVYVLQD